MAIFNELLTARYGRAITRLCSMKGPVAVNQVSGEIMPVFPLFFGPECRFLEGWGTFQASIQQVAVAAQFGGVLFRNPPGSNVVAVFFLLMAGVGAATDQPAYKVFSNLNDFTTIVPLTASRVDNRGPQQPNLICSRQTTAAVMLNPMVQIFLANNSFGSFLQADYGIPVLPGDSLQLGSNVANQSFIISAGWYERILEPSELQP